MRVMVTGGAGFIGSHLVDQLLAAGHEPAVIDNLSTGSEENVPPGARFFEIDIRDTEAVNRAFDEFRPSCVSHQAAQMSVSVSIRKPALDAEVNVIGLLNVLQAARQTGVERFVFASSGGVLYGDVQEPATEESPADPISPYGFSKWIGEKYLRFFTQTHGLQTVALRYSNVYGPRQNPYGEAGVVAIFCQKMLAGEAPTIFGDGGHIRDYVYGPDVARVNLLALTTELTERFSAFNVGTSIPTDVNTLAATIHTETQRVWEQQAREGVVPIPVHGEFRQGDLLSSLVSCEKARQQLGWEPTMTLINGCRQTVEWFAEQQG